jgi:hypothetical protein
VQKRLQTNSDKMDTIIKQKQKKLKKVTPVSPESRTEKLAQ